MAKKEIEYPVIPKLYKVLRNGQSQSGGRHTWKTSGGVNTLDGSPRNKWRRLQHCHVGFHLTTDWRKWYTFGDDVYTASVPSGEFLVKAFPLRYGKCEDKVVAAEVTLSQKNQDPLARLLKQFWNDSQIVASQIGQRKGNYRKAPTNCVLRNGIRLHDDSWSIDTSSYNSGINFHCGHKIVMYPYHSPFVCSGQQILNLLVKSVDHGISAKERQHVHDLWNLWKAGWIVYGQDPTGKYVVS